MYATKMSTNVRETIYSKNMSEHDLLLLQDTVMDMIADIKDNILVGEEEQSDLIEVEFFFNKLHPEMIAHYVNKKVVPHKKKIEDREEEFFVENKFIFSGLSEKKLSYYKTVMSDPNRLNKEDKHLMWQYLDALIILAEKIKKDK